MRPDSVPPPVPPALVPLELLPPPLLEGLAAALLVAGPGVEGVGGAEAGVLRRGGDVVVALPRVVDLALARREVALPPAHRSSRVGSHG